jgi:hypothetical protein
MAARVALRNKGRRRVFLELRDGYHADASASPSDIIAGYKKILATLAQPVPTNGPLFDVLTGAWTIQVLECHVSLGYGGFFLIGRNRSRDQAAKNQQCAERDGRQRGHGNNLDARILQHDGAQE